jgi:uncharacterized membrane protein (UPF0127 family)
MSKMLGLMFKKNIDPDFALIFPLSNPRKVTVHMHFVRFPLDVLLLDENKRIMQMDTLEAGNGKLRSEDNVSYVIELPAGTIAEKNIALKKELFF